ncbi:BlaI/MecI/CopY family transcriptional regulator [Cytophagaceae bacterium DM2B3-1]|uniref:BlaI/MecI/CopY family transcriptional regulator n=1 Tax=Xanthocytophaga flava TaxID=3048013 RepID=A0AAE3QGE0_9BACT|nr:BlaI/MecI/CopY family transcriptional regulator [Xanthocytophaga flavus]MDJ1478882.1 BlaI/MecI/CopY family transcriptional regulator [Xanthocytophaga flavus]MDJ1495417.1 BlaI/MecI/CopY family transcriptional regulator [Xanthocytophaga flavus]
MRELTRAEEEVMQILWKLNKGFVKDIIELLPEPKPAYNTVSTIVRILETKGFVGHNAYGKTHEYYPLISKTDYTRFYFKNFLKGYFGGSFAGLVSFFAKEEDVDLKELEELLKNVPKEDSDEDTSNA